MIRRRSTTQLQPPESDAVDETRRVDRSTWDKSNLVAHLGVAAICLSLALFFFSRYGHHPLRQNSLDPIIHTPTTEPRNGINWAIHPKMHAGRPPEEVRYNWRVSSGFVRPDGVLKRVYLINDLFPGPTIQARSGDTVVVEVLNCLEDEEGISFHWHGLSMKNFNDMDGAVGVTQNPIRPGHSFTYRFRIADDQHGTFWYHAHEGVQRADGLFGAFVVHQPSDLKNEGAGLERSHYDEERILMIGDWYHRPAKDVLSTYLRAASFGNEPVPDSVLLNGMGAYNCSSAVPARPVDCEAVEEQPALSIRPSQIYRLRLINVGQIAGVSLAFDGAVVEVLEVDGGTRVRSYPATSIGVLYPGQRADVILRLVTHQSSPSFTVSLDDEGFRYTNPALAREQTFSLATSVYSSEQTEENTPIFGHVDLQHGLTPLVSNFLPIATDLSLLLYTTTKKLARFSNIPYGFMNQTSWKPQSSPPGYLINLTRAQWDDNQFVPLINTSSYDLGGARSKKSAWVTIILNNLDDSSHPFHLHGYSVYILQTYAATHGWGSYSPYELSNPPGGPLDLQTALLRDTFWVPRRGYVVLGFWADNEGIWMLHCHVLWHQASGMAMAIQIAN